ncbi:hypothetical protein [Desulfofundulus thermobenzoicus]|nr:hypothetical protein [Desulfofundulus thermobenzoicus]
MERRITWKPRLVVVKYSDSKDGGKLLSEARRYLIECLVRKDKAKGAS